MINYAYTADAILCPDFASLYIGSVAPIDAILVLYSNSVVLTLFPRSPIFSSFQAKNVREEEVKKRVRKGKYSQTRGAQKSINDYYAKGKKHTHKNDISMLQNDVHIMV